MRSVSHLVLADDPASGLVSAAVFCFRRYSAARVLFQLFSALPLSRRALVFRAGDLHKLVFNSPTKVQKIFQICKY